METSNELKYQLACRLLQFWDIADDSQWSLLGLDKLDHADFLVAYQEADQVKQRDINKQVQLILSIHRGLTQWYEGDRGMIYSWMNINNPRFNNQTPIEYAMKHGLNQIYTFINKQISQMSQQLG